MGDAVNWDEQGQLEVFAELDDGTMHPSRIGQGPLHSLVRTVMADEGSGRIYTILTDRPIHAVEIKALFERADFPADEDPAE